VGESASAAYDRGYADRKRYYEGHWHWQDQIFYFISGVTILGGASLALLIIGYGAWSFIHWAAQQDNNCQLSNLDSSGQYLYHCERHN